MEKLKSGGEKLRQKLTDLGNSSKDDRLEKMADVAGAIGELYDSIDKAKEGCKPVPNFTLGLGYRGALSAEESWKNDPDPLKRPSSYLGLTFSAPF